MHAPSEPTDEDLISFAASLLQNLPPRLHERHVLEEAVQQHRGTWLTLYEAAAALKRMRTGEEPPEATTP